MEKTTLEQANDLYINAVKSGQRNLPEPLYWLDKGSKMKESWEMMCEKYPDDVKDDTPFNKYMQFMSDNC